MWVLQRLGLLLLGVVVGFLLSTALQPPLTPCRHPQEVASSPTAATTRSGECKWAYVVYITSCEYAGVAGVTLSRLQQLHPPPPVGGVGCHLELVALVPPTVVLRGPLWSRLSVRLISVPLLRAPSGDPTWIDSLTRLQIFGPSLRQFRRVVCLDVDTFVRRRPDELFSVPLRAPARIAMPPAYWLPEKRHNASVPFLASIVIVFEPNDLLWNRTLAAIAEKISGDFDMDILNRVFWMDATVLDEIYSGNTLDLDTPNAPWSHHKTVWEQSPLLHFYSWPLPKPWRSSEQGVAWHVKSRPSMTAEGKEHMKKMYREFREEYERVKREVGC